MRALFLVGIASFGLTMTSVSTSGAPVDAEGTFAKANADYAAGHFPEAIAGYESLVRGHQWNPALFYDLGNAYFRKGDSGRAILNYERARAQSESCRSAGEPTVGARPGARSRTRSGLIEAHLSFLNRDQYAWLAAAAFWSAATIFCGFLFRPATGGGLDFRTGLVGHTAGAAFAAYQFETGSAGHDLAIVTSKNIQARLATAESAGSVLQLPAGSEIKILSTRGDWSYAALPNDLRGWIPGPKRGTSAAVATTLHLPGSAPPATSTHPNATAGLVDLPPKLLILI